MRTWPSVPAPRAAWRSSRRMTPHSPRVLCSPRCRCGITDTTNTLFVFTVDEGDHFVGGSPTPSSCDGVNIPHDRTGQVGELNANIDTLVTHQFPAPSLPSSLGGGAAHAFTVHGDDAPPFLSGKESAGGGPRPRRTR